MDNQKKLGLFGCIGIIAGGCIGSAIYSLSGMTFFYAGPSCILSWIAAALIMCLYGMQVGELAVRFPKSGGVFVFPKEAFGGKCGDFIGFISAWGYIVGNIIAIAFSAIYVGIYLGVGFPVLNDFQIPLAVIFCIIAMVLNLWNISDAGKFNYLLTGALVVSILIFGCVSVFGGTFDFEHFKPFFSQGIKGSSGWISAVPIASVAYGACVSIAFIVSEVKNPNKNIPLSLFLGLAVVLVLYLFMLFGFIGNLDVKVLLDDKNAFFRFVPIYASIWVGNLSKYPWLCQLISISALFALITSMLVLTMLNSKALKEMSVSGYLPAFLSKESDDGVCSNAVITNSMFCVVISCFPKLVEVLVSLGALNNVVTIIITCLSLIVARRKTKLDDSMYKVPGGFILPLITIVLLILCYVPDIKSGSFKMIVFTLIVYLSAVVVFCVNAKKLRK